VHHRSESWPPAEGTEYTKGVAVMRGRGRLPPPHPIRTPRLGGPTRVLLSWHLLYRSSGSSSMRAERPSLPQRHKSHMMMATHE